MRSRSLVTILFLSFLQLCQCFLTPDIYTLTQPAGSSPDLGEKSKAPTVPSQSRHAAGPVSGLNIFLPNYASNPNWLPLVMALKTVGLQIRVITSLNTTNVKNLLIYTSTNVTYSPSTADVNTLTTYVNNGGNLIFMSQIPTNLRSLAGVSAATVAAAGSRSIVALSNTETKLQALQGFNFTEYYDINLPIYENYTTQGLPTVGYTTTGTGVQTLGKYLTRSNGVDSADTSTTAAAIIKRQPSSTSGYVYSFGFDLGLLYISAQNEFGNYAQWYDGHYYPGYDIGTRIIKNIVTTSSKFVSLWTVPYNKGLAFTTTWDIDTYVSYPHGQGIAAAAMERGAAGNLNLHTKYVTDAYEQAYFQYGAPYIYQITGFRNAPNGLPYIDFGSHSVSHSPNAVDFPYGSLSEQFVQGSASGYHPFIHECSNTTSDGKPDNGETCVEGGTSGLTFWTSNATASGEVRVSGWLIRYLLNTAFGTNYNLTTYRPGNLAWNKFQSTHCVANGYIGGSSCAGNDHITHLPFQVGHNREAFAELPYYEFPLQWSDGDGNMSSADFPGSDFSKQVIYMKQMARYGGHYNILIHPSDAVFDKIQIQRALHDAVRPFAVFFNQTGIANWWTIRDRAVVDITSTTTTSATMTVKLDGPVEGLTLQVPKTYTFQSATNGLTACQQVSYDTFTNAVVLRNTKQGSFTLTFSVGTTNSTVSNCPDFTPQPETECVAWDVAIDDFLELYFYTNGVNLLLLQTVSTGLSSANVDGRLQLTASTNTGINSYYTEVSRFCFDASIYTHLFFDMVAPVGVSFSVELVSYDSGCNTEVTSPTVLDIAKYAAADGKNHTVTIPLSDFTGQDFKHVRGLRIMNISPAETPVYIDNIKIQKRCFTAPGEDHTQGLSIESFQNVDRYITGINNVFGATDTDGTMAFAKLSELGKMQLLPSSSGSYFYTSTAVNGANLNASTYTALSLNVRGPAGGSFDVVVTSGSNSSTNATVNTGSLATLSQGNYTNITIPLSSFSGLNVNSVSRITLRNFTPFGGSAANNFTVRWISLLGGTPAGTPNCTAADGYVVLDYCNVTEFATQTNALGAPFSDDHTMATYSQTTPGSINLVPRNASSYFQSYFTNPTTGCATVNSSYDSIQLTISGPVGATAGVGFKTGGATCGGNVTTVLTPVTFASTKTQVVIPFSRFPTGFNQNSLQSFVMTNFSSPGSTYQIYSLTFVGPANQKGCSLCSGTLVNTCTFLDAPPATNQLLGVNSDDGTMTSYTVTSDGSLGLSSNANAYWYSVFGRNQCYDANTNNATGLQISVAAPAGTNFNVAMRWMTDVNCTTRSDAVTVPISNYVTFAGNTTYQVARIPFSDFPGLNASRLNSVALQGFNPAVTSVNVGCISLTSIANNPKPPACPNCPATAWLNYCTTGLAGRNANNGVQSDDGTMKTAPAIANGALQLQPLNSGSYWYSLQNCADVSSATNLVLNVTGAAGSTFAVQLQSSSAGCNSTAALQRATVTSGAMTGSSTQLSIPFSSFTSNNAAFDPRNLYAVALQSFTDFTSNVSISCAYFGNGSVSSRGLELDFKKA